MTDKLLYTQIIPAGSEQVRAADEQKRVSSDASINTDFGDVAETGSNPGTRPIRARFKGTNADIMARELVELAQATNYAQVPYFTDDNNPLDDEYVTVNSMSRELADPRDDRLVNVRGTVTRTGSPQSHFRSVQTRLVDIDPGTASGETNPFGASGPDSSIAIPTTGTKTRWYNETSGEVEDATIVATQIGRVLNWDQYDPTEPSFDDPTLIWKQPMGDEGKVDARVWDTYGESFQDGDDNVNWQKVFTTGHVFNGEVVIENAQLRLTIDEDTATFDLEAWGTGPSYSTVSKGTSGDAPNWELDAFTLTRISPSRVEGQTRWRDTVNDVDYNLNITITRATTRILFTVPENEGALPSGLDTKLDNLSESWGQDAQPVQKIISRSEVNK